MTFDSGNVRRTKSGLKLELSQEGKAKGGTRLSSTRYMYYGRFTIVMRHKSANGVVSAAITMSNTKDEIDWEFTTSRKTYAETNFYWKGVDNYDNGGETDTNLLPGGNGFDVNEWHAYTVDWKPESITWEIDGKVRPTRIRLYSSKDPTKSHHLLLSF